MTGGLFILTAVFSVAFASFTLYDSERAKSARFTLGVILLSALAVSLVSLFGTLSDVEFSYTGEDFSNSAVEKTLEEAYCEGVLRAICTEFSIKRENIEVSVSGFDSEKLSPAVLYVTLRERGALSDFGAIRRYAESLGAEKCIVEVSFE